MMFYHCPYHSFDLKYRLAIYDGIHPKKMIKKVMGMLDERYCTDLGQGTQYKLEKRSDDWQMSGEVAAQRHTGKGVNWKQYSKNQEYIYSIIQKCNDRGIQVILLTTPTYITYREHLPKEVLEVKDELCNKLQNTFDNVVYLNMLDDSRFVPDDFFDADHLNEFGAQKLTYILNDFIQRNQ